MILLLLLLISTFAVSAAEPVIIDTDCGYFGDDGTAIVMLARSPEKFRIEAFTVVAGNVDSYQGYRNTRQILKLLELGKTPVFEGASKPLRHTREMSDEAHRKWGPLEFRGAFEAPPRRFEARLNRGDGVMEMIRRIEASPNEITLVALGPMTNIAKALHQRPEIAAKVKRLVFMGGQFRVPGNASKEAEFNFWFDPEAAQIVLRSAIREKIMFGLDVCNKAILDKTGFDAIAGVDTKITRRFKEDFGKRYPGFLTKPAATVSLWDALVAAWMLEPSLFGQAESIYLDVDTNFSPSYGKVIPLDRTLSPGATPVQMINDVDYPRMFELFRKLLCIR